MTDRRIPDAAAPFTAWSDAIAAPEAAPAGGAAAALSGALAAAAAELVARLTLERGKYAAAHARAEDARSRAAALRSQLVSLARRDAEAFAEFRGALALPRSTPAERAQRDAARNAALVRGADLQLDLLRRVAELADLAADLAEHGLGTALGDAAAAGFLAAGSARSAYWAVRANLQDGPDPAARGRADEALALLERAEAAEWRIRRLVNERIR